MQKNGLAGTVDGEIKATFDGCAVSSLCANKVHISQAESLKTVRAAFHNVLPRKTFLCLGSVTKERTCSNCRIRH